MNYETQPAPQDARCILEALPHFNRGAVSIPITRLLLRELRGLERRVHRSGKDSVDHGAHGCDDYANALCGAIYPSLSTRRAGRRCAMGAIFRLGQVRSRRPRPRATGSRESLVHVDQLRQRP